LEFDTKAFEDLAWWVNQDRRKALKIIKLIQEIQRNPLTGTGQPEPLKYDLQGFPSFPRSPRGNAYCVAPAARNCSSAHPNRTQIK